MAQRPQHRAAASVSTACCSATREGRGREAIRALLDDKERSYVSGLDGVVAGYILLDPKAGWEYLLGLIKDPEKDFPVKYASLKTVRYFWEFRSDIIPQKQSLDAIKILMDDPDIADMPIEDVRKWKLWDLTPTVLGYAKKESHSGTPITMRAILKFAIMASWADRRTPRRRSTSRPREERPQARQFSKRC